MPPGPAIHDRRRFGWREIIATAWLAVFLFTFFAQTLPNGHLRRMDVLREMPFALMDALDPPPDEHAPRGVRYLGQRIPLWSTAALIAAGAWGLGVIVSRTLPGLRDAFSSGGLDRAEKFYFEMLLGLSALSLMTLGNGLCGTLSRPLIVGGFIVMAAGGIALRRLQPGAQATEGSGNSIRPSLACARGWPWFLLLAAPFLIAMLLGSVTPPTDFDVKEYHLGGPKEWYQLGRITFLDHNVYTSFPFLTEMLLLDGMVVFGDWYWGGVAGQAVLMLFQPLTALGLWCFGRRYWSNTAGNLAALIYLSTPWIYRISIIGYAEGGLATYLFAAVYALSLASGGRKPPVDSEKNSENNSGRLRSRLAVLAGVMAGSAMACKYTGLVSVVLPIGVWIVIHAIRSNSLSRWKTVAFAAALYVAGVAIAVGPWLLKNIIETGNPVYPLAYSVFDGRGLDARWAERWRHAHSRPRAETALQESRDFAVKGVFDVAAVNDWQSPLIFAFAPLAFLWRGDRRIVLTAWLLLTWVFLSWWFFMHYIDRFWVPLLPLGALLAGCGAAWFIHHKLLRAMAVAVIGGCCLFNLVFCATGLGGYNAGLTDLNAAKHIAENTNPVVRWLNEQYRGGGLPKNFKLLSVGEAQLFDAEFPYLYNTVFDQSLFEEWTKGDPGKALPGLPAHGVTHVLVNWSEILRYRQTYGYTDYVHPGRFNELVKSGLLGPPMSLPAELSLRPVGQLSNRDLAYVRKWAPELIVPCGDGECFVTNQVYMVTE